MNSTRTTRFLARERVKLAARKQTCRTCGDQFTARYGSDDCPKCANDKERVRKALESRQ